MIKAFLDAFQDLVPAMVKHWKAAITGSLVTAVLAEAGYYAFFYDQDAARHGFVLGAALARVAILWGSIGAVVWAYFGAWQERMIELRAARSQNSNLDFELQEKRSALLISQSELERERAQNKPNLKGVLGEISGGGSRADRPDRPYVITTVTIKNPPPGADSVAEGYKLWFTKGDTRINCELKHYPGSFTYTGVKGQLITFLASEFIYIKTKTTPIPVGGQVTGRLVGEFDGNFHALFGPGATVFVAFSDINGDVSIASRVMEDTDDGGIVFQPGTDNVVATINPAPPQGATPRRPLLPGELSS
jgi:hypothetical protein